MTYEIRTKRGYLTTSFQDVFGVSLFPIQNINPNLTQIAVITELKLLVRLPSKPLYDFVPDGTDDARIQEQKEAEAWNNVSGNYVEVRYGSNYIDPIKYKVNNVLGGYSINFLTRLSLGQYERNLYLSDQEILALRITESLGSGDSIAYEITGYVMISDAVVGAI